MEVEFAMLGLGGSIIRMIVACVLGGIIGLEREKSQRPAGLQTHVIVCLGACLSMITSFQIFQSFYTITNADPARLSQGVISGIGFLGAGTIIREGNKVKGLTTAASLWGVACIGLSVGVGLYGISISAVILLTVILRWLNGWEGRFVEREINFSLNLKVEKETDILEVINTIAAQCDSHIMDFNLKEYDENNDMMSCNIIAPFEKQKRNMIAYLYKNKKIKEIDMQEISKTY